MKNIIIILVTVISLPIFTFYFYQSAQAKSELAAAINSEMAAENIMTPAEFHAITNTFNESTDKFTDDPSTPAVILATAQ